MDWTLVQAALVLTGAVIGIGIVAAIIRRSAAYRIREHGVPLRIIARQPVGTKASIVIAEIADKRLVLGVTEHSVSLLATLNFSATPNSQGDRAQPVRPAQQSLRVSEPPPAASAQLSFRAYLSSMFQRAAK
ncbi:MAG: flagellar biosynthetic protein FliO [Bacteroidota bacterium]|nr:flagellar biosynthetic protein FliO [Candidatus Kapabacteria bacterium]MCS7302616.1 flagellar biosynthetic protein FliO [Candidatus Kapabacteria bacterium]MCX7936450.1 flagellar biosynthetic protein FliO [Chlorobiota bacterium]MDW8074270.1 flagellar biosynthetic protein FliO [Bacteroidota bacterium]MDW8271254.1 flagellar biosynthetic protein FliO [Bacteroidota bacterium]